MSVFDGLPSIFTGAFGEAVTIRPDFGGEREITAVFTRRSERDILSDGGAVVHQTYVAARSEDVADIERGDEITVRGVCYHADTPEVDAEGMTKIPLRRAT